MDEFTNSSESMTMPDIDDKAPAIDLPATQDEQFELSQENTPTVVFFYPKDDTPGCTNEAKDFTRLKPEFDKLGVSIVGISPDPLKKHEKFSAKHGLGINLASDEEKTVLNAYGVWVEKSMYGRQYMGIERSTFLIGKNGRIVQVWRKVKVKDHADAVLEAAQQL